MRRDVVVPVALTVLVALAALCMGIQRTSTGDRVEYRAIATPKAYWKAIGNLTASNSYPAVADRDHTTIAALPDANTVTWSPPCEASGWEFRFETSADADSTTVEMLVAAGPTLNDGSTDDDYMLGGTFALTGGTQTGLHTNVYVDTIGVTDGILDFEPVDSGNNRVCIVKGDGEGYGRVVFIASTLQASSTLYIQARWW